MTTQAPRTSPLPPAYTCPVCSGLKSSLDMNCPPCSSWASHIFTRLGPSGIVLVYRPTRGAWTMES